MFLILFVYIFLSLSVSLCISFYFIILFFGVSGTYIFLKCVQSILHNCRLFYINHHVYSKINTINKMRNMRTILKLKMMVGGWA